VGLLAVDTVAVIFLVRIVLLLAGIVAVTVIVELDLWNC
jgi:hypothetical protein